MKNVTVSVTIGDLSTNVRMPLVVEGVPQTEKEIRDAAVSRACEKLYGRNTFWWADSGLAGYGQVMRSLKNDNGSTSVTYPVGLDVDMPDLPEDHEIALRKFNDEVAAAIDEMYSL